MIFKLSKLSYHIENDIEISKLKNLFIKIKLQNALKYWCFEGKKALFLINCTKYRKLLENQRNSHII